MRSSKLKNRSVASFKTDLKRGVKLFIGEAPKLHFKITFGTFTIMHLVFPSPPPHPPKNCITIVSNFSWLLQSSLLPTEIKDNGYTKFVAGGGGGGGVNKEHYGLCQNDDFANPAAVTRTCFRHNVTRASTSDNF